MATNPKRQNATKAIAARRVRNPDGTFQSGILPPDAKVDFQSLFVSLPGPLNQVLYNPDIAYREDWVNAERMLYDLTIYSALQERMRATALLPWSIVPPDEDNSEQKAAADDLSQILSETPNLTYMWMSLLMAIWMGRSATYNHFAWDFSRGRKQLKIRDWVPINGDSLLFGPDGVVGYKIGSSRNLDPKNRIVTIEGQGERIPPESKQCWVTHGYQRVAAPWEQWTKAGSIHGLGLRNYLYPYWKFKQEMYVTLANWAEKFKSGWVVGYFQMGNQQSEQAIYQALTRQQGSSIQMLPRQGPEGEAAEGFEVIDPPAGTSDTLEIIREIDRFIHLAIVGQELSSKAEATGLGSNLASVHEDTFARVVRSDALALQESVSRYLLSTLQEWNGYRHLPPMKFEFSFDLESGIEKLEKFKILKELGFKVPEKEAYQAAGCAIPLDSDEQSEAMTLEDAEQMVTNPEDQEDKSFESTPLRDAV